MATVSGTSLMQPDLLRVFSSTISCKMVVAVVFRFYGFSTNLRSYQARSFILTTLFLDKPAVPGVSPSRPTNCTFCRLFPGHQTPWIKKILFFRCVYISFCKPLSQFTLIAQR